ncbi:hypothetical protein AbraCBS73388_003700 [Aspergillus brasiliensis]|uniref:Uncharacterized protein n=1 Tax=Aspergillus brasiliensis TaxID=319629 RepID=A0A9W5Z205_9EURO|nr:hypothetical protein AbraCBS73388_003700 [Aspergillus brasiliensis]
MVYRWRQSLPAWATAGNLKCSLPHGKKNQDAKAVEVAGLHIASSSYMPGFGVNFVEPITTQLQYYRGSSLNWDEFVNYSVANEGDWPDAFYEAYLSKLEACGMNTPRKGIKEQYWREATSLARLEDNIAPWWLENVAPGNKD